MPESAEHAEPDLERMTPVTRVVVIWSLVGVLLLAAFGSAIGALQQNVYSPSGFVGAYLNAIARHDTGAALAMPGTRPSAAQLKASGLPMKPSHELLRSDVLGQLSDVHILHDDRLPDGTHRVTARYELDGRPASSNFIVANHGSVLGIFASWRFAVSPLAIAHVAVLHATTFTIASNTGGTHTVDTRAASTVSGAFNNAANYLVFTPSTLRLGHESRLLTAPDVTKAVTKPGAVTDVSVTTVASAAFVNQVKSQLGDYLDECVKQQVLQPAGCPMGVVIDDRIDGTPVWSMKTYPEVTITAGAQGWVMPTTAGMAHLKVKVQSLFDGSISLRDDDEPFTISLTRVVIREDGSLDLTVGP